MLGMEGRPNMEKIEAVVRTACVGGLGGRGGGLGRVRGDMVGVVCVCHCW